MVVSRSALLIAGATITGLVLFAASFVLASAHDGEVNIVAPSASDGPGASSGSAPDLIVVEVAGAVARPGVFRLPKGARAGDAIAAAGGYGPRVDATRASQDLNLAAPLRDGDRIRVPSRDDPNGGSATGPPSSSSGTGSVTGGAGQPLDLNRATAAELDTLPGIGPATAAKIIAARYERPFASVDELVERKLLSSKTLDGIRSLLIVR